MGRLIDDTGAASGGLSLDVEDGQLVDVLPTGEAPSDAEAVALSALSVVAGLFDCHLQLVFGCTLHARCMRARICWLSAR